MARKFLLAEFVGITLAILYISCWFVQFAYGEPPANADPALRPWFKSLQDPATGNGCCSQADCRGVESRHGTDGNWQVFIGAQFNLPKNEDDTQLPPVVPHWMDVPPNHILLHHDNPVGRGVACWRRIWVDGYMNPEGEILCFIPPYEF